MLASWGEYAAGVYAAVLCVPNGRAAFLGAYVCPCCIAGIYSKARNTEQEQLIYYTAVASVYGCL